MDDPLPVLTAVEARVLGSLVEKQITTPDNYPLSLNALTNACNQLTNRDPVMSLDEQTIVRGLDKLREKRLATLFHGAESRVAKYRHALQDVIPLTPAETALICTLLLRGPQTAGELRSRAERLFTFDNLPEVEAGLAGLIERALVVKLPKQPGAKESRFAHLLSGPVELGGPERAVPVAATAAVRAENERVAELEASVAQLKQELAELREQFAAFRKQFE